MNDLSFHPDHLGAEMLDLYATNRLTESQVAHAEEHMLLCRLCCDELTAIDQEIKMIRLVLGTGDKTYTHAM